MSKPDSKGTLIRIRPNNSISKTTYHDEPLLYKLQLLYKLLLLYLQLLQGRRGLNPVSLQQMGLLDKVHLQLFLQLRHQLLQLLSTRV